jgi:hypothetical protein
MSPSVAGAVSARRLQRSVLRKDFKLKAVATVDDTPRASGGKSNRGESTDSVAYAVLTPAAAESSRNSVGTSTGARVRTARFSMDDATKALPTRDRTVEALPTLVHYEGERDESGEPTGRGFARYDTDDEYEGDFVDGRREGMGSCTFASGVSTRAAHITHHTPAACTHSDARARSRLLCHGPHAYDASPLVPTGVLRRRVGSRSS